MKSYCRQCLRGLGQDCPIAAVLANKRTCSLPVDPLPPCLAPAGRLCLNLATKPPFAFQRADVGFRIILLTGHVIDLLAGVDAYVPLDVAAAEKAEAGRLLADALDLVGVGIPPSPMVDRSGPAKLRVARPWLRLARRRMPRSNSEASLERGLVQRAISERFGRRRDCSSRRDARTDHGRQSCNAAVAMLPGTCLRLARRGARMGNQSPWRRRSADGSRVRQCH